jgi:nucleoside-diphosphate-sugar epimerase
MTTTHHDNPILVTGAAGAVGSIGRNITESLLARGHRVRALVRRAEERTEDGKGGPPQESQIQPGDQSVQGYLAGSLHN